MNDVMMEHVLSDCLIFAMFALVRAICIISLFLFLCVVEIVVVSLVSNRVAYHACME